MSSKTDLLERLAVRELIENWTIYRDSRDWKRFRTLWHDDGVMQATWFQGTADAFIKVSQEGYAKGVRIHHMQGESSIDIAGKRAIAQTRMVITQRAEVEGALCDVTCTGRFYDFLEKRKARWGLVLRQPIYETDRIDPVTPGAKLKLDAKLLAKMPEGYRHLAYLQTKVGYPVKPDMPGRDGPALEALYRQGAAWLKGEKL
jgi:hypothetical protein